MSVELIIKVTGYDIDDALDGGDPGLVLTREDAERLICELVDALNIGCTEVDALLDRTDDLLGRTEKVAYEVK